jgi:arylsulfatase
VKVVYLHDGGFGTGGTAVLLVDGSEVARERIERTVPIVFSMSGETFDVGIDTGAPVGPYEHGFAFTGSIIGVTLERLSEPDADTRRKMFEGEIRAGLTAQ